MRGRYYKSLAIMDSRRIIVLFVILKLVTVSAEPIRVDYSNCQLATYVENVLPNASIVTEQCCPPPPTRPIIDGVPPPLFSGIQVRQAYQCTDDIYRAKLERGYALMRALPDDDPRSFTKQYQVHCAYCAGAFSTDPRNGSTGIDIHFSWLFFPWHRFFLYFHERILQSLLGDPTFMLNYWNWDNPFTIGDGSSPAGSGVCNKAGFYFPNAYQDPTSSLYDDRRSDQAKGRGRFPFVDLSFNGQQTTAEQLPPNITAEDIILGNLNVMYTAMVSVGTTPVTFLGRPYRAGDLRGAPTATGGGGILEGTAHAAVHLWTGHDPPFILVDMGGISTSARDPVFFSHHSNIDRVFSLWRDIGPLIGAERSYFDDPDFLNAEFVFYDENLDLRRVHVRDALDTIPFGYVYQEAPLPWLNPNGTRSKFFCDMFISIPAASPHLSFEDLSFVLNHLAVASLVNDASRLPATFPNWLPTGNSNVCILDDVSFETQYSDERLFVWHSTYRNSCCPLSYNDTLGQAYNIPAPVKDVSGRYHLTAGIPLVIIVDRPASQGKEEFLTLSGIHLNRRNSGGFDIYVHLLDPTEYIMPTKCAEYAGRFTNMATSNYQNLRNTFLYKASLTKTLIDNNIPSDASKLVVTIFSLLPKGGREQTTIEDIYIGSD